jgi:cytochrome c oxidase cbb3-type subunit I/II
MARPASTTPGSVMPAYTHLQKNAFDVASIGSKMRALRTVGVPYTDGEIETAPAAIAVQAKTIAAEVAAQQGPTDIEDKEIVALTAYLQRLGTDIKWKKAAPAAVVGASPAVPTSAALSGASGVGNGAPAAPVK